MKQALPPFKCGRYTPIGSIVAQILSTTQFVWLLQALAMFVECSYHGRYKADNYWESLNGACFTLYFFYLCWEKWNTWEKCPNRDGKWSFDIKCILFMGLHLNKYPYYLSNFSSGQIKRVSEVVIGTVVPIRQEPDHFPKRNCPFECGSRGEKSNTHVDRPGKHGYYRDGG